MDIQPLISNAAKINGWMSHQELEFLARAARGLTKILEVGCFKGRSTRVLADNCSGNVYALDPWNGPYRYEDGRVFLTMGDEHFKEFVKNTQSCNNIIICRGTLTEYVDHLPVMDFIFLDGDHRYEEVKSDINNSLKLLRSGGILAGHDYTHNDWPGVKKAVDELLGKTSHNDSIWYKVI